MFSCSYATSEGSFYGLCVEVDFARELERESEQLRREVAKWKNAFIPFAIVHAAEYGRSRFGKEGCLHFTHYDLLHEAGAKLDAFTRCGDASTKNHP